MGKKEKEKQKKQENQQASFFKELGGFMKPYQGKYAVSIAVSVFSVLAGLAAYAFVGLIAGMLFSDHVEAKTAFLFAALAVVCKLASAAMLNASTWVSHQAAYMTLRDIRRAVSEKLIRLPMGYIDKSGTGRLKSLLVDHIEGIEKTLAHVLPELTANMLAPCCLLVWMFFLDWRLALCALVWIFLGFSVTGGMMKGYEEKYAGQIAAFKGMNQAVVEYVNGIEVIKNFGRADACYKAYQDAVYGHAKYNIGWQKETQIYSALGMAVAPFSIFPVLIAGLIFYGNGTLEASTLFLMLLLTFGVFGPLMRGMMYFDQVAQMGTSAKEIRDVLDVPEVTRGSGTAFDSAEVAFDGVTFAYDKDAAPAISEITFTVPQGTMLALVGPSGSGKSTIAKLLAGYWEQDAGEIRVGGKDIRTYSQEALNEKIAYVDQETFLFDTTILENIRMGCPTASDEEAMEAAGRAGCDAFIRALPQGYDTQAGAAGGRLSGGERQRIAIARAMMKKAPILILDEATSSTDPENEATIQQALSAAARDKTLIVVAHRLMTVMGAQQIAFVDSGRIKAIGTHEELLADCPDYRAMWTLAKEG